MVFYIEKNRSFSLKAEDDINKKESAIMLNKQILKLREELNNSIINGANYEVVYKLSIELDELITKYYTEQIENRT